MPRQNCSQRELAIRVLGRPANGCFRHGFGFFGAALLKQFHGREFGRVRVVRVLPQNFRRSLHGEIMLPPVREAAGDQQLRG